jgi:hypothetical protein
MKKRKLPTGLYYRPRSSVIWCPYYIPGRNQPVQESTRTTDVDEAKRFRASRLAEHPTTRAERLTLKHVTVADALDLYVADCARTGVQCRDSRVAALRHTLGATPLAALTRAHLDALCDEWQASGVRYPERNVKFHTVRPVGGATCNRFMATLKRARTLAMEKLNVDLPRLTFPHFAEAPAGSMWRRLTSTRSFRTSRTRPSARSSNCSTCSRSAPGSSRAPRPAT